MNYWISLFSYISLTIYVCLCNSEKNDLFSPQRYGDSAWTSLPLTDLVYNISLWQQVFTDVNGPSISTECSEQLQGFSFDSKDPSNSLDYLLDSFAKPPTGLFEGNFKWLGDWDECKSLNQTEYLRVILSIPSILGETMTSFVGASMAPDMAICLPADCCNRNDTIKLVEGLISRAQPYVPINLSDILNTSDLVVVPEERYPIDALTLVSFGVLFFFVFIVLLATIIHMILKLYWNKFGNANSSSYSPPDNPRLTIKSKYSTSTLGGDINIQGSSLSLVPAPDEEPQRRISTKTVLFNAVRSFSLYSNVQMLLSPPSNPLHSINCLTGIRSLSILWILLCRSYLWLLFSGGLSDVENLLLNTYPLLSFTVVWNGFSAMETLFIISGCLAMFLSLKELEARNRPNCLMYFGKYYLYHFLRVTPTYLIVLLFMWKLTPLLGSGPLWSPAVDMFIGKCEENWWTNVLYINTFYPVNYVDTCLSWTFYISIEVQFILFSPIFIIPAYYLRAPYSILLPSILFILTTFFLVPLLAFNDVNTHLAYIIHNYLTLTNISQLLHHAQSLERVMINEYYAKFYFHYTMYLSGLLLGYFLYKIPSWRLNSKRDTSAFDKKLSFFCINSFVIGVILSIFLTFVPNWILHGLPVVPGLMYSLLTIVKPFWAISVCFIIFAIAFGFGGPVGALLSWGIWAPLSRLTFMVYLIHPIVMVVFFLTLRRSFSYSTLCFSFIIASLMVVSYGVAALISLFIYLPLKNSLGIFRKNKINE